jgi:hypothetical protein
MGCFFLTKVLQLGGCNLQERNLEMSKVIDPERLAETVWFKVGDQKFHGLEMLMAKVIRPLHPQKGKRADVELQIVMFRKSGWQKLAKIQKKNLNAAQFESEVVVGFRNYVIGIIKQEGGVYEPEN